MDATNTTGTAVPMPAAAAPVRRRRSPAQNRVIVWSTFAALLLVAPLAFPSSLGISMLSQIGIAIVACLSYNMLLGQGGMLSFGHAVYSGLATFVSIQALLGISSGAFPLPVSLIPIVGGIAGMFFAILLGYVTTKKAGTPFAMTWRTMKCRHKLRSKVIGSPSLFAKRKKKKLIRRNGRNHCRRCRTGIMVSDYVGHEESSRRRTACCRQNLIQLREH